MDLEQLEIRQARFVELLDAMTARGDAVWAASDEPGFVNCLVGEDLIKFEILGSGAAAHVDANGTVHGVTAHFRNVSFLWLEANPEWERLVRLLRAAPVDRDDYHRMVRYVLGASVSVLEHYLNSAVKRPDPEP